MSHGALVAFLLLLCMLVGTVFGQCSDHSSCTACANTPGCGWCGVTSSCVSSSSCDPQRTASFPQECECVEATDCVGCLDARVSSGTPCAWCPSEEACHINENDCEDRIRLKGDCDTGGGPVSAGATIGIVTGVLVGVLAAAIAVGAIIFFMKRKPPTQNKAPSEKAPSKTTSRVASERPPSKSSSSSSSSSDVEPVQEKAPPPQVASVVPPQFPQADHPAYQPNAPPPDDYMNRPPPAYSEF